MKYCQECGGINHNEARICRRCGCNFYGERNRSYEDNDISAGLCVLSFLIPLFGFIYWAVKTNYAPTRAKACGITAMISFIFGLLINIGLLW